MAPNSLFAVLLRSPWWVSFLVAGAIALVCGALLPPHIAPYAAVGAAPIFLVGCMAAWRQWRAPGATRLQAALDEAARLPWRSLADWLERAWQAEGQAVQRLAGGPADFRIEKGGRAALVSARRCKAGTHGVEPLRELHAAAQAQEGATGVYVVLQGSVSDAARDFARDHGLAIMQAPDLAALLLKAPAEAPAPAGHAARR
ncbi:restriction endonuclease [Paracidovorax anthurii]|uniref:Restriction system protein n=1 Tax=Paracidovorax anthurii TaxID=78229 RepID=A0A328YQE9_9BURK|nr:restriction endonuclease [Paracidovorax anthurii]RAR76251.1 restriction system protein [Paracidovorax anthurii]